MDSDKQLDSAKASSIEVRTTTDRVDHASEKPERRLSHSTDASKNSGKKTAEKRADDRASPDAAEQPAKKMKRGKYISRACTAGNASTMELLARLAEVEHRLNMIPTANFDAMLYKSQSHHTKGHSAAGEDHQISSTIDLSNVMEPDGQTFAGEISMSPGLQGMEDDMDRMAADSSGMMAEYPSRSPNPAGDSSPRKIRAWLEAILDQHGVVADEEAWRRYLHVFLEEIHILYPILHAPTLWETFNEMWEYSALWPLTSSAEREQKRMAVALVCFCLALGRCSVSSRVTDANGVQSAGWTLYSVGMSLLQDSTEMSNTAAKSLLTLQMLLIRVIYLFRLDATQRATRLLALAVSNAHIIGLHRQSTLENMPAVASQMYTRSWWSIYVLDRRLAIESGRPYLIQDSNVDTALPLDLSDAWLTRFQSRPEKISQLQREVALELASEPITAIPYIAAMVRYSRVVGKAWELLYGVKSANSTSSPMVEIWVSGKMMRWVQKLTSLVQRTFKEGRTDRESSQRRDSVSLNQEARGDDMQQLTPHSDQAIESENGISADFQQTRLLGGLPAGKQGLGGSPSWSFGTDGQGPNLPDWAMSDFNFETIIAGEGTVQRALQPGDLVTIPENGSSTMKISNIDLDECMFGSLGPNGIFNLDMDMEQATLGLFSPDISRYA
ncbi:hypothetical protein VdG1_03884 [Verticillium dahliae VDG1]|nr:hypothetical protein VdG1_03884 [Verticillium dahliae VDG1]